VQPLAASRSNRPQSGALDLRVHAMEQDAGWLVAVFASQVQAVTLRFDSNGRLRRRMPCPLKTGYVAGENRARRCGIAARKNRHRHGVTSSPSRYGNHAATQENEYPSPDVDQERSHGRRILEPIRAHVIFGTHASHCGAPEDPFAWVLVVRE